MKADAGAVTIYERVTEVGTRTSLCRDWGILSENNPSGPHFGEGTLEEIFPGELVQARPTVLVLRRRPGECVLIGDEIEIELLAVTHQGAQIGIRAPKAMIVLRKELKITQDSGLMQDEPGGASISNIE